MNDEINVIVDGEAKPLSGVVGDTPIVSREEVVEMLGEEAVAKIEAEAMPAEEPKVEPTLEEEIIPM